MATDTNTAIMRRLMEDVGSGNLDALDAHPGMAPMKPFLRQLQVAFPDATVEVKEMLTEGEWTACRMIQRGTQRGEWMQIPATGRYAEWEVIATYRIVDGLIVEQHAQADNISLMRQLDAQPARAGG